MSMKNSNDTIRNRARDLPACELSASANCTIAIVPQLTSLNIRSRNYFICVYFSDIHIENTINNSKHLTEPNKTDILCF